VPLTNTPDSSWSGRLNGCINADQAFSQLSSAMTEYLQMVPGIITEDDPSLGLLHNEQRHSLNYSWRIVGKYMGNDPRRVHIPLDSNHLQDAGGRIARSFCCFRWQQAAIK